MIDFLLINPNARDENYQSLKPLTAIEPPVWCMIIAGYLRGQGYNVNILDANALELDNLQVACKVEKLKPQFAVVVVYGHNPSASTQIMPSAGKICKAIKGTGTKVIMVGGHVAALPSQTLREESVDAVCMDEGLISLKGLFKNYEKGMKPTYLWSALYDTTKPLKMPWDLLPMVKYRAHNWHTFRVNRQPYASIYTSLGCPYNCTYCSIQAPFKKGMGLIKEHKYRKFNPETVLGWIDDLQSYGVKNLKIADEMFLFDFKHVEAICDGLIERDYDLNIWAYARVDRLDYDLLKKMKKAGFNWLCIGIESGSKKVRKDVHKSFSQKVIYTAVDQIHKAGIHIIANYLFGLPEDDLETMQETLDLAIELNCEFANFYCTMAIPGSELYQTAIDEGWNLPKTWSGYSQLSKDSVPLDTRHITGKEVQIFRDNAFQEYFRNHKYLEMIDKTFGFSAVEEVLQMVDIKIRRG